MALSQVGPRRYEARFPLRGVGHYRAVVQAVGNPAMNLIPARAMANGEGTKIEIAKQIGNAVPPVLAARLADVVLEVLLAGAA